MWHVSSRSGVATLRTATVYTCYLLTYFPQTELVVIFFAAIISKLNPLRALFAQLEVKTSQNATAEKTVDTSDIL